MASADAVVAQGLECCLCFEYFNEPKNLTCGHTFCKECIDRLYKSHPERNRLNCPTCRQITKVNNGDMSKLQTNFLIKSMVHDVKATKRLCTACDPEAKSPAVLYCAQCHAYMCDPCAEAHRKFKITKKHDVVSMEDVKRGKVKERRFCTKHPEEEKLYVCTSCNVSICFRCRVINHGKPDHEIKEVSDYKMTIQKQIKSLQNKAMSKIEMIEAHAEQVKERKAVVEVELDQRIAEIKQSYGIAVNHLTMECKDLIDRCTQKKASHIAKLEEIKESEDKLKSCIQSASQLVGNGMKALLEGQKLAVHNRICCDFEKLLDGSNPNTMQTKYVADHAKGVTFIKSSSPQSLGELQQSDWQLGQVSTFLLSHKGPCDAVPLTDGRVAVCSSKGMAIEMITVDEPQEAVTFRDLEVRCVSVLSDGRYIVQDFRHNITLYTQAWERLNVRFNTPSHYDGKCGGMCVDRADNIYVGYAVWGCKIDIFRPDGGAPFRKIHWDGDNPWEICHMNHSRRLVVYDGSWSVLVIDDMDEKGTFLHHIQVDSQNTCIAVLKDDSILIACWEDGLLSMELYTKDLKRIRTVLRDFPMADIIMKLFALPTGGIAVVSETQFIVFRKI